ncbi:aminopeptidase [Roseateles depolymerans]|uniref:Aminopeptidase n=1 Tax=Roseateles depolymerans TaxID=76731 RepID=A0A0U3M9S5_9BURK|nr:aminopeptidase [Roseateles depolymerans]ALV05373.1 aminopeptidase [Roseateles depolymerans]REG14611.1 putative aminopeptidase [Roseateles depolymerans]
MTDSDRSRKSSNPPDAVEATALRAGFEEPHPRPRRGLGLRRLLPLLGAGLVGGTLALLGGCAQWGYYSQSISGHLSLVRAARPVPEVLAEPGLDPTLRQQLVLSQTLRDYAITELHLPDNSSYRRYADLHRGSAVWNVVATPPLSLQLKTWCYPIMGCAGYRGYFKRDDALAQAAQLKAEGLEPYVYGVPAYSSLGWSNWIGGDPLLNTFIQYPEGQLARMIFHELAHQVAYADDDTAFNESFATAVEQLGVSRWMQARPEALKADEVSRQRQDQVQALLRAGRDRLRTLFQSAVSDDDKRAGKAEIFARMRQDYEALKRDQWNGDDRFDRWFLSLNTPALAIQGSYTDLVPDFLRLFDRQGRDWHRFYAEVKRLARLPKDERRVQLAAGG